MKKNNKFKLSYLFIFLVLNVFTLFAILNKNFIIDKFQNTLYYLQLSSERQELYNKFEITSISIKNRNTGTAPFSSTSASDENGNDISAKDNYVRTLDKIEYTIELVIDENTKDNSNLDTSLVGGVIKVKATLPNQDKNPNLTWAEDAWMKNVTFNEDKTEITAEFVSDDTSMFNTIKDLSFTVLVGGYKTKLTSEMLPEFEVWMEGNQPDNTSSTAKSLTVKDDNQLIISGTPSYNIVLVPEYATLQKGTKDIKGMEMTGRYKAVALGVALRKLDDMPDYRGVEYPTEEFTVDLKLEYYHSIGSTGNYTKITDDTSDAIDILNGTIIQTYSKNGLLNDDFYPKTILTATANKLPYGEISLGNETNSVVDSGTITATLNNDILSVKFKNYKVGDTFPTAPSNKLNTSEFDSENAYFLSGIVELFIPFYGDLEQSNKYKIDVTAEKAEYKLSNGRIETIENDGTTLVDKKTSDNTYSITMSNTLNMSYFYSMYLYDIQWNNIETVKNDYSDASAQIGEKFNLSFTHGLIDGEFEGGIDSLVTWDASKIGIRSIEDSWFYYSTTTRSEFTPKEDDITIQFGIYKSDSSNGLTSISQMNSAFYSNFTWYDTYAEASKYGTITAVYINDPNMVGNNAGRKYNLYFTVLNKEENIGTTAAIRVKIKAYEDVERTTSVYFRNSTYSMTSYNEKGEIISLPSDKGVGKTILITSNNTDVNIQSYQKTQKQSIFNIQNGNVTYIVTPKTTSIHDDKTIDKTYVNVTLPNGLKYCNGSSNKEPESIVENEDGSTLITWIYENWEVNQSPPDYSQISFEAEISSTTLNNTVYTTKAVIFNGEDLRDESTYRTSTSEIKVVNLSGTQLLQNIDKKIVDKNSIVTNSIQISNSSSNTLTNVRSVEILPKKSRILNGEYTIKIKELFQNQKMYYSIKNIDILGLKYENERYNSNDIDLTSSDWIQVKEGDTIPKEANIIISNFDNIDVSSTASYSYEINTNSLVGGDIYEFNTYLSSKNTNSILKNNNLSFTVFNRIIQGKIISANEKVTLPDSIKVYLLDSNKTIVNSTTTQDNKYSFSDLDCQDYYIKFDVPGNYEVSNTLTNKADSTGLTDLLAAIQYNSKVLSESIDNIDLVLDKKEATITVHHYIDGTTDKLADDVVTTQEYTTKYTTSPASVNSNYELVSTPTNASGTVSGNIEVTYYYQLKTATLTVRHYIEGTTTSLIADEISKVTYTHTYTTSASKNVSSNYELASTKGTLSGTVTGNIEVTYYYKLKSSTLTVKHLEYGTNKVMASEETKNLKYTDEYETSVSTNIPGNYEYHSKTDNYKGIVSSSKIEVIYYYQKKDSKLSTEIKLTTPEEITDKNKKVDYKIDYKTIISDYKGEGVINITANLPYHIDESTSELNGGTYNSDLKTITWTITEDEIDASTESKTLSIIKKISVTFSDLVSTDRIVNTSVTGNIKLDNNERNTSDTAVTYIKIPSKIIIHHYIEGTKVKIVDDIESTNLVGETYVSEPTTKEGYILKKEPDNKNHIYQDEVIEVIYEYEKIKFNIITKVTGDGGIIQGDESVYYGENSTEDNIIIKPKDGYTVSKIIINGLEQEIKECQNGCVLNNFIDVQEDKEIIVLFSEIPDNPNTSTIIAIFTIGGLGILTSSAIILIKKYKPRMKKL